MQRYEKRICINEKNFSERNYLAIDYFNELKEKILVNPCRYLDRAKSIYFVLKSENFSSKNRNKRNFWLQSVCE